MAKKIKDDDIRMECPNKATCYEHLHNQSCLRAYRKENKRAEGYKKKLEQIKTKFDSIKLLKIHNDYIVRQSEINEIIQIINEADGK